MFNAYRASDTGKKAAEHSSSENATIIFLAEPEQSFVTFIVGDDESKKTFQVHKIIAVSKSPVFKAAFDGKFAEAESQSMRLDDIEVEDFGNVVHCLYLGKLKDATLKTTTDLEEHLKLWQLGDRFIIPGIQNIVVSNLHNILASREGLDHDQRASLLVKFIKFAYASDSLQLKQLATDAVVWHATFDPDILTALHEQAQDTSVLLDITLEYHQIITKESAMIARGMEYLWQRLSKCKRYLVKENF